MSMLEGNQTDPQPVIQEKEVEKKVDQKRDDKKKRSKKKKKKKRKKKQLRTRDKPKKKPRRGRDHINKYKTPEVSRSKDYKLSTCARAFNPIGAPSKQE